MQPALMIEMRLTDSYCTRILQEASFHHHLHPKVRKEDCHQSAARATYQVEKNRPIENVFSTYTLIYESIYPLIAKH